MSRSTQEKFIEGIIAAVAGSPPDGLPRPMDDPQLFEAINDRDWANTGTIRVYPVGSMRLIRQMEYAFQRDYVSLAITPKIEIEGVPSRVDGNSNRYHIELGRSSDTLDRIAQAFCDIDSRYA